MARIYVDGSAGRLERHDLCTVTLVLQDGTTYEGLEPHRLFPYTNPDHYISLLGPDAHEVAVVRDPSLLDEVSETVLREVLSEFYMIPKILKLLAVEDTNGSLEWQVLTDHGEIRFRIRNRTGDIKRIFGSRQVMIRDESDNRYLVPDPDALDHHSRRLLFAYL